jgi:hypothetical protein
MMKHGNLSLAATLAALLLPGYLVPATAAEHWIKLRTENFEMYTSNSAPQAVAVLQNLEDVRSMFSTMGWFNTRRAEAIKIIAFRSESEFAPYRDNEAAVAFFQRMRNSDYIVIQDLKPEHSGTAVHELAHLAMDRAGFTLPLWLNEGLADLYSTLDSVDGAPVIGKSLSARLTVLANQPWIDLRTLTGATPDSRYYTQRDDLAIFYAESWALTHMLALNERYSGRFQQFLSSLSSGKSASQAFRDVYGKSERAVALDLRAYLRRRALPVSLPSMSRRKNEQNPVVQEIGLTGAELLLAGLLASHQSSAAAARERLVTLSRNYPLMAEVDESLAWLDLREGRRRDAWMHFQAALEKGSKDADLLRLFAGTRDFSSLQRRTDTCAIDLRRVPTIASSAGWCAD